MNPRTERVREKVVGILGAKKLRELESAGFEVMEKPSYVGPKAVGTQPMGKNIVDESQAYGNDCRGGQCE